jgi:hypothetical protein
MLVVVALVTGCGAPPSLEIESNTTWEGKITEGNEPAYTVKGSGSTSIEIKSDIGFCWTLQKQTEQGMLHVYAKVEGFLRKDRGGEKTTFDSFGVVTGCSGEL